MIVVVDHSHREIHRNGTALEVKVIWLSRGSEVADSAALGRKAFEYVPFVEQNVHVRWRESRETLVLFVASAARCEGSFVYAATNYCCATATQWVSSHHKLLSHSIYMPCNLL